MISRVQGKLTVDRLDYLSDVRNEKRREHDKILSSLEWLFVESIQILEEQSISAFA